MIKTKLSATGEPSVIFEPSELMIGSVLMYEGKPVYVTNLSLDIDDEYNELIGFCELGKTTDEICDWNRALSGKLKPVHLSNDILLNLGFKYERVKGFNDVDGSWWLSPEGARYLFVYDKAPNLKYYGPLGRTVDYLHELQLINFAIRVQHLKIDLSTFCIPSSNKLIPLHQ